MDTRKFIFEGLPLEVTLRDEADASVWAEIFKLREYRRAEETIGAAREPIIDVGAHAGFFTLYTRALNAAVPIFAIEPELNNLEVLKKHLETNKIQNATIIQAALAGHTGQGELMISEDSHNHYLRVNDANIPPPPSKGESTIPPLRGDRGMFNQTLSVHALSFVDLCKKYNLNRISLLKMDIEGGEYDVFESMQSDDYSRIGSVIMEYHNSDSQSFHIIETKLRENGFSVQIFPSHFDKHMGFLWARNKRL